MPSSIFCLQPLSSNRLKWALLETFLHDYTLLVSAPFCYLFNTFWLCKCLLRDYLKMPYETSYYTYCNYAILFSLVNRRSNYFIPRISYVSEQMTNMKHITQPAPLYKLAAKFKIKFMTYLKHNTGSYSINVIFFFTIFILYLLFSLHLKVVTHSIIFLSNFKYFQSQDQHK